jgi:endonuclease/exonuclease/phosphatase family metal-dependent hydrolase
MNPRSTSAALLACLAILTTSASSVRTDGGPAGRAAGFVIATFNMGGGHPAYSHHAAAPDALAARIDGLERRRGPVVFVALQEACRDWVERLDRLLPGHVARFDPVSTTYRADIRCRNPIFGNAVLYRTGLGIDASAAAGHRLDSPPPLEQREMLCVRSRARRLALCTTHLSYNSVAIRRIETATARHILDTVYAGHTKIIGGDLNDEPRSSAFDPFYRSAYGRASRGEFTEAGGRCGDDVRERAVPDSDDEAPSGSFCRSGPPTYGSGADAKKLDYLFVGAGLRIRGSGTAGTPHSDHRLLWAQLSW